MDTKNKNPLSLIDDGHSAFFARAAKRTFRVAWLLVANGCVAWLMFTRLRSVGFPSGGFILQLWFEFVVEVILPIIGIALELVNWKFARWVNVGCFAGPGCFWLLAAIWWHSDPFFGVLLIIAIGLLLVAVLTEVVYRTTRSDTNQHLPACRLEIES
jgi:hypothetical protein